MSRRQRVGALACCLAALEGCCILTYCGPPAIGAPCDAGGGCPGLTDTCDLSRSDAGVGFCTRPCSGPGYFTGCQFSGDTGDGYCGVSDGDGGLVCAPSCGTGGRTCPSGLSCFGLDGGALAAGTSGMCI